MAHQDTQRNKKKEAKQRKKLRQKARRNGRLIEGPTYRVCMPCQQYFTCDNEYECRCKRYHYCSAECRDAHYSHVSDCMKPITLTGHTIPESACLPIAPGGATILCHNLIDIFPLLMMITLLSIVCVFVIFVILSTFHHSSSYITPMFSFLGVDHLVVYQQVAQTKDQSFLLHSDKNDGHQSKHYIWGMNAYILINHQVGLQLISVHVGGPIGSPLL